MQEEPWVEYYYGGGWNGEAEEEEGDLCLLGDDHDAELVPDVGCETSLRVRTTLGLLRVGHFDLRSFSL